MKLDFGEKVMLSGTGICLAGFLYTATIINIHSNLRQRLFDKLQDVADLDSDKKLSSEEIYSVYKTLNLDPQEEIRVRGLAGLREGEMQDYLRIKGHYDPKTDSVSAFWLKPEYTK